MSFLWKDNDWTWQDYFIPGVSYFRHGAFGGNYIADSAIRAFNGSNAATSSTVSPATGLSVGEQSLLDFNARQADLERQFNAEEAQKQRDENRYLSNTAYSRAVEDLKSVGLNPYAFGTAAASPVVSSPAASSTSARASFSPGDKNRYSANLSLVGTALAALVRLASTTK